MKFLGKKKKTGKRRNWLEQSPFSSALFCQRDLMYPQYIGPECAEFSKCLAVKSLLRLLRNSVEPGRCVGGVCDVK